MDAVHERGAACLTVWDGVLGWCCVLRMCVFVCCITQMSAPSNFLSVARVAAFFGGAVFGGIKMGSIAKEVKKSDLELVKEFDEEQAALPADKRSYLGTPMCPRVVCLFDCVWVCAWGVVVFVVWCLTGQKMLSLGWVVVVVVAIWSNFRLSVCLFFHSSCLVMVNFVCCNSHRAAPAYRTVNS